MRVDIDYTTSSHYPLLVQQYGKKRALQILHSGVAINRPSVIPSLQVPMYEGGACDPVPGMSGLGQIWGGRVNPCDASPSWCGWTPFSDYMDSCKPIDPVACQTFGPAMTPANRVKASASGDANVTAYCQQNPGLCAAYTDYKANEDYYEYMPWIAGAAGIALLFALVRR